MILIISKVSASVFFRHRSLLQWPLRSWTKQLKECRSCKGYLDFALCVEIFRRLVYMHTCSCHLLWLVLNVRHIEFQRSCVYPCIKCFFHLPHKTMDWRTRRHSLLFLIPEGNHFMLIRNLSFGLGGEGGETSHVLQLEYSILVSLPMSRDRIMVFPQCPCFPVSLITSRFVAVFCLWPREPRFSPIPSLVDFLRPFPCGAHLLQMHGPVFCPVPKLLTRTVWPLSG